MSQTYFFLLNNVAIYVNNKLIAVFKGRMEDEKKSELFIWLFVISKKLRNR